MHIVTKLISEGQLKTLTPPTPCFKLELAISKFYPLSKESLELG